jgi:hypothetical protein
MFPGTGTIKIRVRPFLLEALESRTLFAGVTLITHGFNLPGTTDADATEWVDAMAQAVATRAGAGTPVFNLALNASGHATLSQVSGEKFESDANGNAVISLDWSALSDLVGPNSDVNAAYVAKLVAPVFTQTFPTLGIDYPLGDLPIHLVGHSRGGSLVSIRFT